MLQPVDLTVIDDSSSHAGHAGMDGREGGGTHFKVKIVASCFQGLSLVQRHRMIYTLLAKDLNAGGGSIHALSIDAKTPDE